ncbi:hypothetical protein PAECIP111893_02359 [Paenibacillus plantiphilus]|uniref:Copper amine oxidase-like N-terminal domain-containing protein n=1 Tax=Paenibacillus plantiphilus TaxID=2905650 RepID=A0ABM9C972_9BACL|nr:copper amine oxidase N-terminal domain-containing protein [Paenibacillus plantiphilus]CAH1205494.1 hypothetical protein PAECIP111893_02359 [Paenibacillus plantiphilus]
MKKFAALLLALLLLIPASMGSAASIYPDPGIKVFLNGKRLSFDIDPVQTKGTTLVQFTTIFKALGLSYAWDQATKTINGYNDKLALSLTINEKITNVNGYNMELSVAPMAYNGKTLVPLRFISETTGMKVSWQASTKTITIESDPNGKIIQKTDASPYLKGMSWGNTSKTVESKMGGKAVHPYGDISTYNNVKFMGYDSELNFSYIYDELSGISYYQGKSGLKDNYFTVYGDIYEGLQEVFGVPNEHVILAEGIEVDWDIPQQLLMQGVEDGDYNIIASWNLPHLTITLILYKADNGKILIETSFYEPYKDSEL